MTLHSQVFQRRMNGATDFWRGWEEYAHGFGNVSQEFWLGEDPCIWGGGTQGSGRGTKAPKGTPGGHPGGPRWPQVGLQGRDPGVWVALGGLQWLKTPRCLGAGNEALHALTAAGPTELRVDLRTPLDAAFAHYRDFAVAGPEEHYRLHLGAYSGTAGARGSWPVKGPRVFGGSPGALGRP